MTPRLCSIPRLTQILPLKWEAFPFISYQSYRFEHGQKYHFDKYLFV
jgi:hypothetical protein